MYDDLTSKQIAILNFIKIQIQEKGYPPSVREIGKAVQLSSTSSVHSQLSKLEKKNYIRRDAAKPRALVIVEESETFTEVINVPIVGSVTAGEPILAVENIEDTFPLPSNILRGVMSPFMLKVKGESMINAGIYDGDFILIHQQTTAEDGDIVIALINQEATVKRFFKEKDYIRLQPENDYMSPILTKDVSILGKVVGLYRNLK